MTTPGDFTTNTGVGIEIPSLLPSALGTTATAIATGIADADAPDPISVRRRWATIVAINTDATVDINLGGVLVPHVSYNASYQPAIDEVVMVNVVDTDMTVIGPTAQSTFSPYIRRVGVVTNVDVSGTAPGLASTVDVSLTDVDPPVQINNVPFNSGYYPTVNDVVHLGQVTNTETYLVFGAVGRSDRRPTGSIEASLMSVPPPNALIMNGQTVSRTTYSALWAWAQLNGLVISGLFTTGNGSSTFGLPDFRGRVPIGVGTLGTDTYALGGTGGNARSTLTEAQMPSHDHNVGVSVAAHATHDHNVSVGDHAQHGHSVSVAAHLAHGHGGVTGSGGSHGGHATPGGFVAAGEFATPVGGVYDNGSHSHTIPGDGPTTHSVSQSNAGPTTHSVSETVGGPTTHSATVSESAVGGTTAVDFRQPYLAINWIIYV